MAASCCRASASAGSSRIAPCSAFGNTSPWRSLSRCMCRLLLIFFILQSVLGFKEGNFPAGLRHHHSDEKEGKAEGKGDCSKTLVFASNRQTGVIPVPTCCNLSSACYPSLQRPRFPTHHSCRDGSSTLEVRVWQTQWEECPLLWLMRLGLCPHARSVGLAQLKVEIFVEMGKSSMGEATEDSYPIAASDNAQAAIGHTQAGENPKSRRRRGEYQEEEPQKGQKSQAEGGPVLLQRTDMGVKCSGDPQRDRAFDFKCKCYGCRSSCRTQSRACREEIQGIAPEVEADPRCLDAGCAGDCHERDGAGDPVICKVSPQCSFENGEGTESSRCGPRSETSATQSLANLCNCSCPSLDKVGRGLPTKRQGSLRQNHGRKEDARICQRRIRATERPVWAPSCQARGRGYLRRRGQDGRRCSTGSPERQRYADESGKDQDHGRRATRGGAEGSQAATYREICFALTDGNWIAFCDARRCRALGSGCLGHLYGPNEECIPWAHSICSSRRFVSVWEASLRGLQAAMDLGNSLGEPTTHSSLRKANRTGLSVTFAESGQIIFYSTETKVGGTIDMPEATFTTWEAKPWTLDGGNPIQQSCVTVQAEQHDQAVMMQVSLPVHHRNEVDAPNWVGHVPERQLPAQGQPESEEESSDEGFGEHQGQHVPPALTPSSDTHFQIDLQSVILFRHLAATTHAQVRWIPIDDRLDDVAHILLLPRNQVVTLYELNFLPADLSNHQIPCIVHTRADLPFGEPMKLTLIDIEIHANLHEENFQGSPALDRRVVIVPETVHRQHLLLATFTDTYCRQVQDRCLVRHNGKPVPLQQQDLFQVAHGDHFLIVIPPDVWCEDPTRYLLEEAHEAELALQPLFQDEALDREQDQMPLLQIYSSLQESSIDYEERIPHAPSPNDDDPLSNRAVCISVESRAAWLDHPHCFFKYHFQKSSQCVEDPRSAQTMCISTKESASPLRMSWTEEFLRAMGALSVAQTELPEFPLPGLQELQTQPQWVQDLMPVWRARARPGPAGMELLAKVETWYTDHPRVQRCYHSRTVILSPDFTEWHAEIKRAWSDVVLDDFDLHFALVYPATVDIAPDVIAQILLVQRPDPYQRSIVVTVADTAVQRGIPISQAVVAEDRIHLHGVLLMLDLLYVCPPENHLNRCHLWSEGREIQGNHFTNAEHGDSFLLHVLRGEDLPRLPELQYTDEQIQIGLANWLQPLPGAGPGEVAHPPDLVQLAGAGF